MQVQQAVKKETFHIAASTGAGTCIMFLVFFALHQILPDSIPFDYRVIAGGIAGSIVAAANFFLMGITVQKITSSEDEKQAYNHMKASYRFRTSLQLVWVVVALVVPWFNGAAGVIPLFFPSIYIKAINIMGISKKNK